MPLEPTEESVAQVTAAGWLAAFRLLAGSGLVLRLCSGETEIHGSGYEPQPLTAWEFLPDRACHPAVEVAFDEPLAQAVTGWRITAAHAPGPAFVVGRFAKPHRPDRIGYWINVSLDVFPPKGA